MADWLGRDDLLALDIDPAVVDRLLRDSPHTGHGGQPVVPAEQLDDLLGMIERESDE
jgi:hypothetical protein